MFQKYTEFNALLAAIEQVNSKALRLENGGPRSKKKAVILNSLLAKWGAAIMAFNDLNFESLTSYQTELQKMLLRATLMQSILSLSEESLKTLGAHRDMTTIAARGATRVGLFSAGAVGGAILGGFLLAVPGAYVGHKAGAYLIDAKGWRTETMKRVSAVLNAIAGSFKDKSTYEEDLKAFQRQQLEKKFLVWLGESDIAPLKADTRYLRAYSDGRVTCTEMVGDDKRTYQLNPYLPQPDSFVRRSSLFAAVPLERYKRMDQALLQLACIRAVIACELEQHSPALAACSSCP